MLFGIINTFIFLYVGICVIVGVTYTILYSFWSAYLAVNGKGGKTTKSHKKSKHETPHLEGEDIFAYFIFLLGHLIIEIIKFRRKFRHFVEMRRRKRLKKTINRLSH